MEAEPEVKAPVEVSEEIQAERQEEEEKQEVVLMIMPPSSMGTGAPFRAMFFSSSSASASASL